MCDVKSGGKTTEGEMGKKHSIVLEMNHLQAVWKQVKCIDIWINKIQKEFKESK